MQKLCVIFKKAVSLPLVIITSNLLSHRALLCISYSGGRVGDASINLITEINRNMKTLANIVWLVCGGLEAAFGYSLAMINMSTFCASIMVCVIYDSFVIFCCKVNTFLAIRERFVQKVTLLVGKNHFFGAVCIDSVTELHPLMTAVGSPVIDSVYSTVTLFARFLGISTSRPLSTAT